MTKIALEHPGQDKHTLRQIKPSSSSYNLSLSISLSFLSLSSHQYPTTTMATRPASSSSSYKEFETRHRLPDPKTAALLVIDMQNYFSSMATPILPSITTTIRLCRRAGIPVILTRHRHKPGDDGGVLGEWWGGDLIIDGTPESELIPEVVLAARGGEDEEAEVVEKETYSAFRNTRLEERLGEMGRREVIVTGVMTNLCCETTAREAFVRGFRVFFSTDATATSSPELHEATLKNMAYGFAYLVDCQRLNHMLSLPPN